MPRKRFDINDPAHQHSIRFCKVANNYALMVTYAYGGDQAAAARDDDATVAAKVREWEIAQGWKPRDWVYIGQVLEGREDNPD